jgi:EH domain-containing protein 1
VHIILLDMIMELINLQSSQPSAELLEQEEADLMKDLAILPRQSAVRKINELVKRIRKVKTLAYIIGYLKSQMPTVMGKEKVRMC